MLRLFKKSIRQNAIARPAQVKDNSGWLQSRPLVPLPHPRRRFLLRRCHRRRGRRVGPVPALQLIPEELEEAWQPTAADGVVGVQLRRIVVLGRFAVLQGVHALVDVLHALGEGWGAEEEVDEAFFEEVEEGHGGNARMECAGGRDGPMVPSI